MDQVEELCHEMLCGITSFREKERFKTYLKTLLIKGFLFENDKK